MEVLEFLFPGGGDYAASLLRLCLSILAGGILGHERGKKRRAAGFRTHILVCMSACLIMVTNIQLTTAFDMGDPTRMPAQIISGIGFLGAGCILVTDRNRIKGLTTAAGLWAAACLGLCIGAGYYGIAIFSCLAIYLILTMFRMMDKLFGKKVKYILVFVEFASVKNLWEFMAGARGQGMKVTDMDTISGQESPEAQVSVILALHLQKARPREEVLAFCAQSPGVLKMEEL